MAALAVGGAACARHDPDPGLVTYQVLGSPRPEAGWRTQVAPCLEPKWRWRLVPVDTPIARAGLRIEMPGRTYDGTGSREARAVACLEAIHGVTTVSIPHRF